MNLKHSLMVWSTGALMGAAAAASAQTVVTFDDGKQGWSGPQGGGGATWVSRRSGNEAPALRTIFTDFGISFSNSSNAAFIGDYTQTPSLQLGLDVLTRSIKLTGQEVSRDLIVELRDHDKPEGGFPYTSVWFDLGTISAAQSGWQHLSVTIADTSATALPTGWGGYGAEDPITGAPQLPSDRSFASVLAGVDELVFTTLVPGYFYADARFDVAVDNISIGAVAAVPEPGSALLLAAGLALLAAGLRRSTNRDRSLGLTVRTAMPG